MSEVFSVLLPGMMYFWVLFVGQGPLQEVLYEKEAHTLARILAAPVTMSQFVLSKLVRCFLLCGLIQTLLLVLSALLFGIHWGNPGLLAAVITASALSMTGFLGFIYSLARTKEQANIIAPIAMLVLAMVGGCMFPFEQLPASIQVIGRWTPNHWAIVALQGVTRSSPPVDLLLPVGLLFGFGLIGCLAAFYLFQRRLGGGR
jgi:ABC-2 type transport system permease protein